MLTIRWSDCTPWEFTKWEGKNGGFIGLGGWPAQPDNHVNDHCLLFAYKKRNGWHDANCKEKRKYLCSKILCKSTTNGASETDTPDEPGCKSNVDCKEEGEICQGGKCLGAIGGVLGVPKDKKDHKTQVAADVGGHIANTAEAALGTIGGVLMGVEVNKAKKAHKTHRTHGAKKGPMRFITFLIFTYQYHS